eukprot:m.197532 g.197532  ORF g.197532 m.197532 type:complete len:117 (+) comp18723_c0_seq10:1863-2213(+)
MGTLRRDTCLMVGGHWRVGEESASARAGGADKEHRNRGVFAAMLYIMQREGIWGLYSGIETKLIQTCLTAAFMLMFRLQIISRIKHARIRHDDWSTANVEYDDETAPILPDGGPTQ